MMNTFRHSPAITGGRGLKRNPTGLVADEVLHSPAITGGRGLKPSAWRQQAQSIGHSPAITGGRGLKLHSSRCPSWSKRPFARHHWRAWIETECRPDRVERLGSFARHHWRAWIETSGLACPPACWRHSPAITGGRGLKLLRAEPNPLGELIRPPSPASVD